MAGATSVTVVGDFTFTAETRVVSTVNGNFTLTTTGAQNLETSFNMVSRGDYVVVEG